MSQIQPFLPHRSCLLRRREEIHLEHRDWMRANGALEQPVNPELRKFAADAFVQLRREFDFGGVGLEVVDVDVEAAAGAVRQRFREAFV